MAKPKITPTPGSRNQHRKTSVAQPGEVPASPPPPKDDHYPDLAAKLMARRNQEKLSVIDEARALQELLDQNGAAKAVAGLIGKSESYVGKRLAVLHSPAACRVAAAGLTTDVELLNSVAKIDKLDPRVASYLVQEAENAGAITRQTVREQLDSLKQASKGKAHSKKKSRPAKKGISQLLNSITGPTPVHDHQVLAIEVRIAPVSSDTQRFQASVAEHGPAFLYSSGVDRHPNYCWVQFGLSLVVLKADVTPRLARFACSDLTLHWVTKHTGILKG